MATARANYTSENETVLTEDYVTDRQGSWNLEEVYYIQREHNTSRDSHAKPQSSRKSARPRSEAEQPRSSGDSFRLTPKRFPPQDRRETHAGSTPSFAQSGPTRPHQFYKTTYAREATVSLRNFSHQILKILKMFLKMKPKFEEYIAQLRALAVEVDELSHRSCTKSFWGINLELMSGGLVSLGMSLAPVTAGGCLVLTVAGLGVEAVSLVNRLTTAIKNYKSKKEIDADNNKWTSTKANLLEFLKKLIDDSCHLEAQAMVFKNSGEISALIATSENVHLQDTFQSSLSKEVQRASIASEGLFLLKHIYRSVEQSTHLQEGDNSEFADQLREQASELEKRLENLNNIYMNLCDD